MDTKELKQVTIYTNKINKKNERTNRQITAFMEQITI